MRPIASTSICCGTMPAEDCSQAAVQDDSASSRSVQPVAGGGASNGVGAEILRENRNGTTSAPALLRSPVCRCPACLQQKVPPRFCVIVFAAVSISDMLPICVCLFKDPDCQCKHTATHVQMTCVHAESECCCCILLEASLPGR